MSPLLSSQGVVLATAMAVSGTVILLALCRQKPFGAAQFLVDPNSTSTSYNLRPCISSDERKREKKTKKKKRVHFADNLVELFGEADEFKREDNSSLEFNQVQVPKKCKNRKMPANRMALYNGILQDRLQRMACSS
ncbi:cytochrome P450 family protein [Tasmannia lanceolata]|uniref:cytochrome P450 family protein n=1 Tax=Tasmannia lanceolata TaxID=3420 RepID=UPI0040648580